MQQLHTLLQALVLVGVVDKMRKNRYISAICQCRQWMDLYQICFRGSSRGRNQLCQFLLRLRGFDSVGGQSSPCHIDSLSPLTHAGATAQPEICSCLHVCNKSVVS